MLGLPVLPALGAPQGGSIERGSGDITHSEQRTTVRQNSHNLIVHWDSFNIAAGEQVDFLQPSSRATALNRIFDQHPSIVNGSINATGRVLLINPSGIIFSPTAHVQVHSLIASSLDISDADFLAERHHFAARAGQVPGRVVNRGLLQAAVGGGVTLLGGSVANEGLIVADAGYVTLAAGRAMTMDFDGDGLLRFAVDEALLDNADAVEAAVDNSGEVRAAGGQVLLSGKAASRVFSNVVNNSGVVSAGAITRDGGVVRLVAGHADNSVLNTGRLDASSVEGAGGQVQLDAGGKAVVSGDAALLARSEAGQGGTVQLTGERTGLFDEARIDVSGRLGGGEIAVGGGLRGEEPELRNSELTLVAKNVQLRADALEEGDGGEIVIWSDGSTRYQGSLYARGAADGDGGFAEVSGKQHLDFLGVADLAGGADGGAMGALLLDPANIEVVASGPDIDGTLSSSTNDITDATDLDSAADFASANSKITAGAVVGLLNAADLSLVASNTITISAAITTATSARGGLTLTANTVAIEADLNLRGSGSLTVNGNTSIATSNVATTGAQTYRGTVTLSGMGTLLTLTASAVRFGNTVTGGNKNLLIMGNLDLDAQASGLNILQVRGTSDIAADVTASTHNYTGLVTLGANVTFAGGRGNFRGGVDGTVANQYGLELAFSDDTTLDSAFIGSLQNIGSLATSGGGKTLIDTDITTVRGQRYEDAVTLGGMGSTRTLTASELQFGATVTGNSKALAVDGNLDLDGAASGLASLSVSGTSALGADVTTTGAQTYTGVVTLGGAGSRTLTANASGTLATVQFTGALMGGNKALAVDGNLDLDGAASGLASLSVSGTSALGADVTTMGTQTYTGAVTLGGTGDTRTLIARRGGTLATVQFADTLAGGSRALGVAGNLDLDGAASGLTRLSVRGTSDLGADVTTTGAQTYTGVVTLSGAGSRTLTANASGTLAAVQFVGALAGGNRALSVDGNLSLGGMATGLASLMVGGTSSLSSDITTTGMQSYTGLVTLGANVTFTGTQGIFTGGVDGTAGNQYGLELAFSGDTTLDSAFIGALQNIGSLTTSGGGRTFINADITTVRGQRYEDAVTLGGMGSTRTLMASAVQFGDTVTGGSKALVVMGNLDLDGAATGLSTLSVTGTSALGADVTTTGAQTYTGAVTLGGAGSRTLTANASGTLAAVTFTGALMGGNKALTVDGNLDLGGTATGLASLMVEGTSRIAADLSTTGAQSYTGEVTLGATVTFTGTQGTFTGGVDGTAGNQYGLELAFSGDTTLDSAWSNIGSLATSGGGRTFINTDISTVRGQRYADAVTLGGTGATRTLAASEVQLGNTVTGNSKALVVTGNLDLDGAATGLSTLSVSGTSDLGADVTTTGMQTYTGAVTLGGTGATRTLTARMGGTLATVQFADTVAGGGKALVVTGNLDLDGAATGLSTLSVSGTSALGADVTTTGMQTYTGAVTLGGTGATRTLTARMGGTLATVQFADTVAGGGKALVVTGNLDLDGAASGLTTLSVGGTSDLGADVTTTGMQTYTGAVTLSGAGSRTLTANASGTLATVQFAGALAGGNRALSVDGNLSLGGTVTGLASLMVGGTSSLSSDITTTGMQSYTGLVTLGANVTFTGTQGIFTGGVDGTAGNQYGLELAFSGDTTLSSAFVGALQNIGSLTTSGGGRTFINTDITTVRGQRYEDAVTLGGTGTTRTLMASAVQFGDTVTGGSKALVVTGNLDLDGAATGLSTLSVSGTSALGADVTTTGAQTYTGAVTLGGAGSRTLTANASGTLAAVTFTGALMGGNKALTVDGNLDLGGTATGLASLMVEGTSRIAADLSTTGAQSYMGLVTLGANVTFTGTQGTFTGGVDGTAGNQYGLELAFSGDTTLDSAWSNIGSLATSGGGRTFINTDITTVRGQRYEDVVTLGGTGATRTLVASEVQLVNTVTGNSKALVVTGNLDLDGAASGLTTLSVSGTSALGADVTTTGMQTYTGAVTLGGTGATRTLTARMGGTLATVQFADTVAGGGKALVVAGNLDLDGAASGLSTLSVTGTSALGADVTTTGMQTYTGAVTLGGTGATRTLTARMGGTLATVQFTGALAGGNRALVVDGNLDLGGTATGLASLMVGGTSSLSSDITTTGMQSYTGLVTLGADVTFTGTQGTFTGGVDGTAGSQYGLELAFSGDTTLSSAFVTALQNIGSLTTSGGGNTFINVDITTVRGQRYEDAVTLGGTGARTLTASEVQFDGAVTGSGEALVVTGNLALDGALSGLTTLSVSGTSALGADVTSTGAQTYTGAVTLGGAGSRTLTANASGTLAAVTFTGALMGGNKALTVDGNLDLGGAATGLASLMVEGTSRIAADLSTTGVQSYKGEVTLGANVTFTGTQGTFTGGVEGTAGNQYGLELAFSGDTTLDSAWSNIGSLATSGGGRTFINTDITTVRGQRYEDVVTLGGTGATRTLTASEVRLGNTVTGNSKALVVAGNLDLDGAASGLITLSVSGTSALGADVTTTGAQTYTGAVTLGGTGATRILTASDGGTLATVQFADTVAGGGKGLVVTGNLDLDGKALGLSTLSVTGTSALGFSALEPGVVTTGAQTYTGVVTLDGMGFLTLTASDGATFATVQFADALMGARTNLWVVGNLDLDGPATDLSQLSVDGTSTLAASVETSFEQIYRGTVTLDGAVSTLTLETAVGSKVLFADTTTALVGGGKALTITGDLDLRGPARGLASLSVSGASSLSAGITTTGLQSYTGRVTLGATVTFTGTQGTFTGGVDGTASQYGLELAFSGDTTLDSAWSNIGSLATSGGGRTFINTDITTARAQRYDDAVTLGGTGATRTLTASEVRLGNTVTGNSKALVVTGNLDLGGTATGLTTLSVSGTSALGADVTSTGAQTYTGAVTLGGAGSRTLTANASGTLAAVTFTGALMGGNKALTVDGNLDLGGTATGLASLMVEGTSRIAADLSTTGAQNYKGAVTLGANVTFTGTQGTFTGGVDGTAVNQYGLELAFSGDTTLDSAWSNIGSLATSGGGRTFINTDISTVRGQRYDDAVTLGGTGATRTLTASEVRLGNTVTGNSKALVVTGNLDLDGAASGLTTLSVSGTSALGADVTTTGAQTYTGAVTLGGAGVTHTLTASEVRLGNTVTGNSKALVVTGNLDLDGAASGLASLSVSGTSSLAATVTTTGDQTYTGAATLEGDFLVELVADNSGVLGTVRFGSTVAGGGVTLDITGNLDLDGPAMDLFQLHVTGSSNLAADVTTMEGQIYDGRVTLDGAVSAITLTSGEPVQFRDSAAALVGGGKALTITGDLDLDGPARGLASLSVSGASSLSAGITTTGLQSYTGRVTLGATVTFTGTQGTFTGGADGTAGNQYGLELVFSGDTTLESAWSNIGSLATSGGGSTFINTDITTVRGQRYEDAVTLGGTGATRTLTASEVQLGNTVTGNSKALVVTGNLDLDGAASGLSTLSVSGTSALGADVTTTGAQTYTGAVTLGGAASRTLTASDGGTLATVQFTDTVAGGGKALVVTGNLDLDGAASGLSTLSVSGTSALGADVTTTGAQRYTGVVTLDSGGIRILTASDGGTLATVQFEDALMGNLTNLTVDGNLDLDGPATDLFLLRVEGTSTLVASVDTSASQIYVGTVTLDGAVSALTLEALEVQFLDTTTALAGGGKALTITGNLDLDGAASGLSTLSVSGTSALGADVTSTGTQTYTGVVTLDGTAAALTLSASNGGTLAAVTFTGALMGGNKALTVDGNLDLGGTATGLASLMVEGTSSIAADLTTTGVQSYSGQVTLGATVTFTGTQGTFTGGVDGTASEYGIELAFSGDTTLDSAWSNIGSLATSGGGRTFINTDITTVRGQRYDDAVTLGGTGATRTLTASEVRLGNTVTGNSKALVVTGNLDLDGAASGLSTLSVSGTSSLGADVTTTGMQTYTGAVTLGGTGATRTLTASEVRLGNTVTGNSKALVVTGNLDLDGVASGLSTLSVSGTSALGAGVTTTGAQTYTGAVTLDGTGLFYTLTANDRGTFARVQFAGALMGGGNSLDVHGNLDLDGPATDLVLLSVEGISTLAASVNTSVSQSYVGTVTLDGAVSALTLDAIKVQFLNTTTALVGGGKALTITGTLDLDGPARGLASLSVSGTSSLSAGITTTGLQSYTGLVTLGANVTFTGTQGTFTGGVNGTAGNQYGLELAFSGDTTLESAWSNIGSLVTSGGGRTFINTDITTVRGQRYEDAVTLGGTGATRTLAASELQFGGTVTGNSKALVVTGNLDLDGAASGLSTLSVSGTSALGADVTTTGAQTYTGVVTLGGAGSRTLTANASGTLAAVTFTGALMGGNKALTVDGNLDLGGTATGLASLMVEGTSRIAADLSTTGAQSYKGEVTLGATVTFTGTQGTFTGGVDGTAGNQYGLELAFSGDTTLDSAWSNIGSLATSGGGRTFINTDIATVRGQRYDDAVTLGGTGDTRTLMASELRFGSTVTGSSKALVVTGNLDLDGAASGLSTLSVSGTSALGADVTTTGMQTYTGAVTLSGAGSRTLTATAVQFVDALAGGGKALAIMGNLDLDAMATGLASLSVSGTSALGADVTSTGAQTYTGAVTLEGGLVQLTANNSGVLGTVQFGSTVAGGAEVLIVTGNLDLDGAASGLASLLVEGFSNLAANVTTTGEQVYTGAVTLEGGFVQLTANNGGVLNTVQFGSTVAGGAGVLIVTGNLDLDGAATDLAGWLITGVSNLAADVTTMGDQAYSGTVTLDGATSAITLTTDSGSQVQFIDTATALVGGNKALTISSNLRLDGPAQGLASLSVSGTSAIFNDVTTTGAQSYTGLVTLGEIVAGVGGREGPRFTGTQGTFSGGLDGTTVNQGVELFFSADTRLMSTRPGGIASLSNIGALVTGNGGRTLIHDSITTDRGQRYEDAVVLDGSAGATHTLTASDVQFVNTVAGAGRGLVVAANLDLDGAASGLASLEHRAGFLAVLAADVATTGAQTYGSRVSLESGVTVTLSAGNVATRDTVTFMDGVFTDLSGGLRQPGSLVVAGNLDLVGEINQIDALTVQGRASLRGDISTRIRQEYQDTVIIGAEVITLASGVLITFDGTIDTTGRDFDVASLAAALADPSPNAPRSFDAALAGTGNALVLRGQVSLGDDVSVRALDMTGSTQLTIAGDVTLHVAPDNLQLASTATVVGSFEASLTIPGLQAADLRIGDGGLMLAGFETFNGHLVIGGRLHQEGIEPYYSAQALVVNTATMTLAQEFRSGGSVTFLAGDILLEDPLAIDVGRQIHLFASGNVVEDTAALTGPASPDVQGIIDAGGLSNSAIFTSSTVVTASGEPVVTFVATDTIIAANRIVLDLGGGEVDVATGAGTAVQFDLRSDVRDARTSSLFEAFINFLTNQGGLTLTAVQTLTINPAVALLSVSVIFVDVSVFEEELTLYGQIGTGIALALSQCEEQEDCAPNITEEELDGIISDLMERVRLLQEELADASSGERERVERVLAGYREELQKFTGYRAALQAFLFAAEEAEEDFDEASLSGEDLSPEEILTRERKVRDAADILTTINVRAQWMESLKEDTETRERLRGKTGIDLTPDLLDRLIEATKKEIEFFENRLRQILGIVSDKAAAAPEAGIDPAAQSALLPAPGTVSRERPSLAPVPPQAGVLHRALHDQAALEDTGAVVRFDPFLLRHMPARFAAASGAYGEHRTVHYGPPLAWLPARDFLLPE